MHFKFVPMNHRWVQFVSSVGELSIVTLRATNTNFDLQANSRLEWDQSRDSNISPAYNFIYINLYLESFLPRFDSSRFWVCYFHHLSLCIRKRHLILTDWQIYTQIRFGFKNNSTEKQLTRGDVMKMPLRNRKTCDFPISHGGFANRLLKLIWNALFLYGLLNVILDYAFGQVEVFYALCFVMG